MRWYPCPVRHRLALSALVATVVLAANPLAVAAQANFIYAGHWTTSTTWNGQDGYIQAQAIIMNDPYVNHHNHWFGMGPPGQKVQIGVFQGTITDRTSPNRMHMYVESESMCANSYNVDDLGEPPTPNYAYYVNYTGGTTTYPCGFQYQWAYRVGSVTSPPVYTSYMSAYQDNPSTYTEIYWAGSPREVIKTNWFGLNHQHNVNLGYALRVYKLNTNTWTLWTLANVPGTSIHRDDDPPDYDSVRAYYAYITHDCPCN